MDTIFSTGSLWRRWDLHVHTPETVLNNQFGHWDEYLDAIERQDAVKVLGVTDYLSITNYSKLKVFRESGRIKNIALLIPNIEFRIAPPTDKATAVNIHLLVSPDDPDHEKKILNALGRLSWRYGVDNYSCLPGQLIALGRAINPKIEDDRAALTVGTTQFKIDFTTLRYWLENETWLKQNSIIAVAAGKDGLSAFRTDGAWAALRDEITRFAKILFTGRPGERDFWLNQKTEDDRRTVENLGGSKPCVHGSDAHSIATLFRPDNDRFCWIKADPTFEGLRQIIYEPADRVYIGPTPPLYHNQARVIKAIKLSSTSNWFDEVSIPLNPGLVSVIGQKGSGKSALAEIAAYAAGSWHSEDSGSFLKRAGSHVDGIVVELQWGDDAVSTVKLGSEQSDGQAVRYLSQKFVERLCADDNIGTELVREIEAVIFSYLDPTDTLNASDFTELRALRTEGIMEEGERLRAEIMRLIREECALRDNATKLPEKKARIKTLTEECNKLSKQMPTAANEEETLARQALQAKREALNDVQQAVVAGKQKLNKINDIRMRLGAFTSEMSRFLTEIEPFLREADISPVDWAAFKPIFSGDTETPLANKERELRIDIAAKTGLAEAPMDGTICALQGQIRTILEKESLDKARQERIKTIQVRITTIGLEIKKIEAEILQIEGPEKTRLGNAAIDRSLAYVAFFKNLRLEHETLSELYAPVRAYLAAADTPVDEQSLEFSIRWEPDLPKWLERGSTLFDQRKSNPYGTIQALGEAARKILQPAWASGEPDRIAEALDTFLIQFRNGGQPHTYLRSGVVFLDILQWIYEVDHIRLSYGLKYNGVDLEKLSPGTKGIVLLILYLGMDQADTRPLIVDQPDENLDNESIFTLLSTYFKLAKKRRQIILITHNPNLVVNGDSEQVIVATCERRENGFPYITYKSGSLENSYGDPPGIRENVCRILEGGSDAFRKREQRYSLVQR
jgi:energy-coupling factor transporter ATP-binding protein EcfA2